MSIYNAATELNTLLPDVTKLISLWKIEQAIDNNKSFIVPSHVLHPLFENFENAEGLAERRLLGLPIGNFFYIHALSIWAMNPTTVVVSESVMDFIYKSKLLDYVSPELLFSFPSQAFLVNQRFGNYDGILFCKDMIDNGLDKYYSLNICLFSNDCRYGKFLSFSLPSGEKFNPFKDFKDKEEWSNIAFVFYVLLYVLNEFLHKQDILTQDGTYYLGFHLEQKIEQTRFLKGNWRNAHWHTYNEKTDKDRYRKLIKWIQPVWIAE